MHRLHGCSFRSGLMMNDGRTVLRCTRPYGRQRRVLQGDDGAPGELAVGFTRMLSSRPVAWSLHDPFTRATVIAATIRECVIEFSEYPLEIIVDLELAERRVATEVLCLRPIEELLDRGNVNEGILDDNSWS